MSFPFRLPMFADGATSCNEIAGEDPDSDVCGEKHIIDDPKILVSLKKTAISNGANTILAPTAGATHQHLSDIGFDDDFTEINQKIISITKDIAGDDILVGGCVVPSTLFVAPYGKSSFEEVYLIYLEKITILKNSGADFILLQEQNNLCDMRAGVLAAKSVGIPVFVIMNVDEDGRTKSGTDFIAALITLQAMGADSFGIYCTDGIDAQIHLINQAFPHSDIPLIAYFESDNCTKEQIIALAKNGISVFIDKSGWKKREYIDILSEYQVCFDENSEKDSYAAAIDCEAFFLPEILELSDPIRCDYDMSDKIIGLDNESINAVHIFLDSTDDSALLVENATMSRLPFLIQTNDIVALEAALRYYQGRLIIDTRCDIDEHELKQLSEKYGAILY